MKMFFAKQFFLSLMNFYDITFFIFILIGLLLGLKKGFSDMFFSLIKNILVVILTVKMMFPIVDMFRDRVNVSYDFLCVVIYSVNFVVFYAGFTIGAYLIKKILEIKWIAPLHTIFGGVVGAFNWTVLFAMITLFFTFFPSDYFFEVIYERSYMGYNVAKVLVLVQNKFSSVFFKEEGEGRKNLMDYIDKRRLKIKDNNKKGENKNETS